MQRAISLFLLILSLVACGGSSEPIPTRRPTTSTASAPAPTRRPTAVPTKAWYEGGTLHSSTAAQWLAATPANRLATAADWVSAVVVWEDINDVRRKANDVVECVDGTADVVPEIKASELASTCVILFGWELQE